MPHIVSTWYDPEPDCMVYATWSLPRRHALLPRLLLFNFERGIDQWYTSHSANYVVVQVAVHRKNWRRFSKEMWKFKPDLCLESLPAFAIDCCRPVPTTDMSWPMPEPHIPASVNQITWLYEHYKGATPMYFGIFCYQDVLQQHLGLPLANNQAIIYLPIAPQVIKNFRQACYLRHLSLHKAYLTPARAAAYALR